MGGSPMTAAQRADVEARAKLSAYDEGFRAALEGELSEVIACAVLLRYELLGGNMRRAAESLGISRSRMHAVMRASGRDPRLEQ